MTTLLENPSLFVRERQKLHQYPIGLMEDFWKTLPDSDPENHAGCGYIPSGVVCHSCGRRMGEALAAPYCYQREIIEDDHMFLEVAGGNQAGKSDSTSSKLVRIIIQFLGEYRNSGRAAGEVAWIVADTYELTRREYENVSFQLKAFFPKVDAPPKQIDPGRITIPVKGGVFSIRTRSANDAQTLRAESPIATLVCEDALLTFDAYKRLMERSARSRAMFPGFGGMTLAGTFEGSLGWKPMLWQNWQSPSVQESKNARSMSLPSFSNVFVYGPGIDENGIPHKGGEDHPEIQYLKDTLSPSEYDEKIRAIPAPPSGRVHYAFDPTVHVLEPEYDEDQPILIGIDPGYSGQPSTYAVEVYQRRFTALPTGERCQNMHYWGIDEIAERKMSPGQIAEMAMHRFWWRNPAKTGVIDVAGRQHSATGVERPESNVETWRQVAGLPLLSQPVRIMDGIRRMDSLLIECSKCGEPYLTFSPKQKLLISELGGELNPFDDQVHVYSWQTDKAGNVTGHTPLDWWCDGIKATTYLFYYLIGPTNSPRGGSKIRARSARERMGLVNAY